MSFDHLPAGKSIIGWLTNRVSHKKLSLRYYLAWDQAHSFDFLLCEEPDLRLDVTSFIDASTL